MRRFMRVVNRRRNASNPVESIVQLSVPKEQLHVLASDLGVPPFKSGTLFKYTNVVKRWKLRHFTLENGVLHYASASSDEEDEDQDMNNNNNGKTNRQNSDDSNSNSPTNKSSSSPERERRGAFATATGGTTAANGNGNGARKKSRRRRLLKRSSKDDNEKEIKGSINIQHAMISPDDSDSCRFAIDVGHDVYHCRAETRELRDEWVAELNRSITYFRGLIQRAVARAKESNLKHQRNKNNNNNNNNNNTKKKNNKKKNETNSLPTTPPPQPSTGSLLNDNKNDMASRASASSMPLVSPASTNNRSTAGLSNGNLASDESEESVLEDDGLREAEQGHRALIAELRRIATFWKEQWMETATPLDDDKQLLQTLNETFGDTLPNMPPGTSPMTATGTTTSTPTMSTMNSTANGNSRSAATTAKGLIDLITWCLHVLQTNDDVFDRRLKADLTRRMAGAGLPVFPPVSPTRPNTYGVSTGTGAYMNGSTFTADGITSTGNNDNIHNNSLCPQATYMSDDGEIYMDALSHPNSKRSSFANVTSTDEQQEESTPDGHTNMVEATIDATTMATKTGSNALISGTDVFMEDQPIDEEINLDTDDPMAVTKPTNLKRIDTATLVKPSYKGPRTHLPQLPGLRERLHVFGFLKDAVGKDLSKISLPVGLNEPISFVQRLAEDIEYCELLDKAAEEDDPNCRMMYVAAMVISHYSSTQGRVGKPFNPLLGETACLVRPDKGKGVRFISEQVSHHPPISACYAEGSEGSWKYYNAIEVKNKFWGKSLEVFPTGLNHIEIPKYGDHYVLEQVTACVHNIVVGKLWLDNYGTMEIVNRTNGGRCVIEFSKTGWMSDAKSFAAIKGTIYDASGKEKIKLGGNWTKSVYEDLGRGRKNEIWAVEERPPEGASQTYNMTKWAISLNAEVEEDERPMLPPTDSRLRPDQRALENGKMELGSKLKQALEEGQRKRRREMEERGEKWEPLWFEKVTDEVTGQTDYRYKGTFFEHQAKGDWSNCTDIFSSATSVLSESSSASP